MNTEDRSRFDKITQLTPPELTVADIDFLFARRTYLGKTKRDEFAKVLQDRADQVTRDAKTEADSRLPVRPVHPVMTPRQQQEADAYAKSQEVKKV